MLAGGSDSLGDELGMIDFTLYGSDDVRPGTLPTNHLQRTGGATITECG